MDNEAYKEYLSRKSSGENISDDEYMYIEYLRLASYVTYPINAQTSTTRLAKSGLFYQGKDDEVRCFSCKGTLRDWTWTQSPDVRHKSSQPECHFMLGRDTDNIPFETNRTPELTNMLDNLSIKIKPKTRTVTSPSTQWEYNATERDVDGTNLGSANSLNGDVSKKKGMLSQRILTAIPCGNFDEVDCAVGTGNGSHLIGLDEIEARMDTPSTRVVLDMGCDRDLVMKVITKRLRTTGDDFPSVMALLDSVFAVEEKGINGTFFDPMATTDVTNETGDQNNEENELATLRAENEEQRDTRMCKICFDNDACIVFLPCGHLVTCSHCASAVRHCPICRKTIKGTVRTILS